MFDSLSNEVRVQLRVASGVVERRVLRDVELGIGLSVCRGATLSLLTQTTHLILHFPSQETEARHLVTM